MKHLCSFLLNIFLGRYYLLNVTNNECIHKILLFQDFQYYRFTQQKLLKNVLQLRRFPRPEFRLSWLSGNRRVFNVLTDVSAILSWLSSELKCDSGAAWPTYIRWLSFIHTWCVLIGPCGLLAPDQ